MFKNNPVVQPDLTPVQWCNDGLSELCSRSPKQLLDHTITASESHRINLGVTITIRTHNLQLTTGLDRIEHGSFQKSKTRIVRNQRSVYTYCLRQRFNIMSMVTDRLTGRTHSVTIVRHHYHNDKLWRRRTRRQARWRSVWMSLKEFHPLRVTMNRTLNSENLWNSKLLCECVCVSHLGCKSLPKLLRDGSLLNNKNKMKVAKANLNAVTKMLLWRNDRHSEDGFIVGKSQKIRSKLLGPNSMVKLKEKAISISCVEYWGLIKNERKHYNHSLKFDSLCQNLMV